MPKNTRVYLEKPTVHFPQNKKGKPAKKTEILGTFDTAEGLFHHTSTEWETFYLRPSERGTLIVDFVRYRVWTVDPDGTLRQEWLLIRKGHSKITYSLSNAPLDIDLLTMAQRKSQRFFIERSNHDVKSELGWDEFQGIKYRSWQHHLAFTILASWFVTETRLEWADNHPRDPLLLEQYQTDVLPNLSVANVRTLLRAVMPLPQLSPLEAAARVVEHLDKRTRSCSSRLRGHSET